MTQFEIKRIIPLDLFGIDASFTNASLLMVIAVVLIAGFLILAMGRRALVPGRLQSIAELSYEYIANMVRENLGEEGMKFFPWVFTIFIFILTLNLLGLIPHSFTVTSHIIVTFAFAAMVWITGDADRILPARPRLLAAVRAGGNPVGGSCRSSFRSS